MMHLGLSVSRSLAELEREAHAEFEAPQVAIDKMVLLVVLYKHDIFKRLAEIDINRDTIVKRTEMALEMSKVCGELNWHSALDHWLGPGDTVDYDAFLNRFRVECTTSADWQAAALQQTMAKIIARGDDLRSLIRTVDRDGDGLVTEEDFRRFLRDARLGLADAQLEELVRHVAFRHRESE